MIVADPVCYRQKTSFLGQAVGQSQWVKLTKRKFLHFFLLFLLLFIPFLHMDTRWWCIQLLFIVYKWRLSSFRLSSFVQVLSDWTCSIPLWIDLFLLSCDWNVIVDLHDCFPAVFQTKTEIRNQFDCIQVVWWQYTNGVVIQPISCAVVCGALNFFVGSKFARWIISRNWSLSIIITNSYNLFFSF